MIEKVMELVKRRGLTADALLRDSSVLSLSFESGRLKGSTLSQEAGLNLRVIASGKVGTAGTTDLAGPDDVVARALASAAEGETLALDFPGPGPVPPVKTFDADAGKLDVAALASLGRSVVEPLSRDGWQVGASVERHIETSRFANTSGQLVEQRATAITVSAEVTRVAGDDVLMAYDVVYGTGVPSAKELEAMVAAIVTKIERSLRIVEPPEGRLPVLFTPQGMSAVLLPINQALSGKSVLQGVSPLGDKLGQMKFDAAFSLTDDPLVAGRVASRAADDEGVVSKPLLLIAKGVVSAFVYDLETATRAAVKPTGHGSRSTFGKPGISYSNLVIGAGEHDETSLWRAVGDGLIVDELIGVGQGNTSSGAFSHPVALAWRIENGELTGRVKDAAVAGNAFELLGRIKALGRDAKWQGGTRRIPPMVLDGVNVARR
ncbi:MAG TPA: TldD/PmbA family protein [Gemmatimonadales bacterium]|jgi:PmbA protein